MLAVCAHPDDESFGLGAVLREFVDRGSEVSVLCFTHGEASTLGLSQHDLRATRSSELAAAAVELGVTNVELLDHPDGGLRGVPIERLAAEVDRASRCVDAELLIVFDEGGVTRHADHCRATEAALAGRPDLPVLAWTVPNAVADVLGAELDAKFTGRSNGEIDIMLRVGRDAQLAAIARHVSQCDDNPVLWRRLELLGDVEALRWLRRPRRPVQR